MTTRILFICLGNICRSPLAEGIFLHLAQQAGRAHEFEIDSAGTYEGHVGQLPDPRSRTTAELHGIRLNHRARQVERRDLDRFDMIMAMDYENQMELLSLAPNHVAKIKLMREYDPKANGDLNVPDPYYGARDGFEVVYKMLERSARELLRSIPQKN